MHLSSVGSVPRQRHRSRRSTPGTAKPSTILPSGRRHYRITLDDAYAVHDRELERGGRTGVLNPNLIESAIGRPYNGYYRWIWQKGAALFESICGNHGFVDGNKRTAVKLLLLLLDRSGYDLRPLPGEDINAAVEQLAVDVADGRMNTRAIEGWLRERLVTIRRNPP